MQERVVTVTKISCDSVPYLDLDETEIDAMVADSRLHDLVIRIDRQNRIIDVCKNNSN